VITLASGSSPTSAWDQPGTIAFLVVFGMGLVLYFLFRSMSRHLRKVNAAARAEAAAQDAAASPDTMTDEDVAASHAGNGASPGN
jgi:hypothetical protein